MQKVTLEDSRFNSFFNDLDYCDTIRNRTIIILGEKVVLWPSELIGLKVKDVFDGEQVKKYLTVREETARFGRERILKINDDIQRKVADFIIWKLKNGESIKPNAPLFSSQNGENISMTAIYKIITSHFTKIKEVLDE